MKDINTFMLIGRLTHDPAITMSSNGVKLCKFSLAVNGHNDKVNFIQLTAFNKTAEVVANYSRKGHRLALRGEIEMNTYETKDGKKVSQIALNVAEIQLLEKKEKQQEEINDSNPDEDEEETFDFDVSDLPF